MNKFRQGKGHDQWQKDDIEEQVRLKYLAEVSRGYVGGYENFKQEIATGVRDKDGKVSGVEGTEGITNYGDSVEGVHHAGGGGAPLYDGAYYEPKLDIKDCFVVVDGASILEEMAATYRQRNAKYGDNFEKVGKIMEILFPDGWILKNQYDFTVFHLVDWLVGKLTRFTKTMDDVDSIHDLGVYAAMVEMVIRRAK